MDEERPGAGGDDEIYDAYLDATLEGRVEDPDVFLARHPAAGAALRGRLAAFHRMLVGRDTPAAPARERHAAAEGLPFERLGDFRLLRRLDAGGMGTVYLAEQVSLARTVALKLVRPELQGSPTAAERFRREALAVARLHHDHVVEVHSVGEDGGVRWIAMEYVEGRGLDEILDDAAARGERVPPGDAVRWAAKIARALDAAHEAGIVHRDVKPSNIRIRPDGKPMLLDFGIARELGADGMTGSAPFIGSPFYAAPEQIAGASGAADARTDVYSLGVTLYQCLAGRVPWSGGTVEHVFREILAEEPPRLRTLNASVARDLEVVVAKAMEKDPRRRYASAADFADDLDALLEFRPVRARPPSVPMRLWKWARRRPGPAAAAATFAAAVVALAVLLVVQQRAAAQGRRDDAAAAVRAARERVDGYRTGRAASLDLEKQIDHIRGLLWTQFMEPDQERLLDEKEDTVDAFRRNRESTFHEVLDLLRRAESLDPAVAGAGDVRAELYLEKWREAIEAGDTAARAHFRERVLASDPGGRHAQEVEGGGTVAVTSDPPGAEVHVFRYAEQADLVPGGEKRLVPVPLRGAGAVAPGTWTLEVVQPAGAWRRHDHILALDGKAVRDHAPAEARAVAARGGVRAQGTRGGAAFDAEVPGGLVVRSTAAPLLLGAESLAGRTPLAPLPLEPGGYLVVLRREGREDLRRNVILRRGVDERVEAALLAEGSTPRGFVRVTKPAFDFWIMEREVTASEYLVFLNDPATLREIAAAGKPTRYPRASKTDEVGHFVRGADGRYTIPGDWTPDWPILGVSIEDARAYAEWATGRARGAGSDVTYALPTYDEWAVTSTGPGDRNFVFGNRFRPRFAKSCYSRRQANPEPVLSYPVDESTLGVFDLCGSAWEWCDSWYDQGRGLHRIMGGSWARSTAFEMLAITPNGGEAGFASGETGFRLVIRRTPAAR